MTVTELYKDYKNEDITATEFAAKYAVIRLNQIQAGNISVNAEQTLNFWLVTVKEKNLNFDISEAFELAIKLAQEN